MGVFGTLVQGALGGFPTIPDAPAAPFVDPQSAQAASITGNMRALPDLMQLGSSVNQYNLAERAKLLSAGVPGYRAIADAGGEALAAGLRGELTDDLAREVSRRTNAQAFGGGYGGSGFGRALEARDLGRTSYDVQRAALAQAPGWLNTIGNLSVGQPFDVRSGFLSPEQQILASQWNETNRFNRDWLQNQLDSIPDPEQAALAQSVGSMTDLVASAALAWAGGGIGAAGAGGMAGGMGAAQGGMMGSQFGAMLGGGQNSSSANIGALMGGMWQPTPATMPSSGFSPYAQVNPLGQSIWDPYMMGGYNF